MSYVSEVFWQQGMTLADVEKLTILKAYSIFQQNKTKTAAALDISIRTLDTKLASYVEVPENLSEQLLQDENKKVEEPKIKKAKI